MEDILIEHYPHPGVFEARLGDDKAQLQYQLEPGRITFIHTEVPPSFRGKGVADQLAHAGLEYAKDMHLAVVPKCPFVAAYIRKHPEYQALLAPAL